MLDILTTAKGDLAAEFNPSAKLTTDKVKQIRALRKAGATLKTLASRFGTCLSNVHLIVTDRAWVSKPVIPAKQVSDDDLPEIRRLVDEGSGYTHIAKQLGATVGSVQKLMRRHSLHGINITDTNREKARCKHGHILAGANLRILSNGRRVCVECNRRRAREHGRNVRANKTPKE